MRRRQIPLRILRARGWLLLACLLAVTATSMRAQETGAPAPPEQKPDIPTTIFPHSENGRWWISGQVNWILQAHPAFSAKYSGANSLSPQAQAVASRVLTLYTGVRIAHWSEVLFDVEETGGHGIGEALGIAGFTNLDVVRNPLLSKKPYVARVIWHQVIALGGKMIPAEPGPMSVFRELPERRLEIRAGKFSMVDFFDLNAYGSDSHLQFLNWTVDNNGAYDYAANTRGYTDGVLVEFYDRHWAARFAEGLMPKVANGDFLDANLRRAHAENMEFEVRGALIRRRQGALRLLGYVNHANMGSYSEAVHNFLAGLTPTPDITAHPLRTTIKYGFGVNFEQPVNDWLGIFGRWGWNEGKHESFAYTEVDQTALIGVGANGSRWRRKLDKAGFALVSNGISRDHQRYLALGGLGFLLGDGRLNYGRENIVEAYYTLHLWRGIFPSLDVQHVNHPGYNRDRGPVFAPALRVHIEF